MISNIITYDSYFKSHKNVAVVFLTLSQYHTVCHLILSTHYPYHSIITIFIILLFTELDDLDKHSPGFYFHKKMSHTLITRVTLEQVKSGLTTCF